MVKTVRVFLALFATLWYTASPLNSSNFGQLWIPPIATDASAAIIVENAIDLTQNYYKPLEFTKVKYTPADAECMAKNIYFEARAESTAGRLAVANVTINRTIDSNYPNTICEVVQDGIHHYNKNLKKFFPARDRCQFSWYCDGKLDDPDLTSRSWKDSVLLAEIVLNNHYDKALIDITDGATHYHANWMDKYPKWSKHKKVMASIDRHIFYKKH
jgi:spore germination cell wall hydrolase CwlJ-like protein